MKREWGLLLVVVWISVTGCVSLLAIPPHEMEVVPAWSEIKAAPVVYATFFVNKNLDRAEGSDRADELMSWRAVLVPSDEGGKEAYYLAVNFGFKDWDACRKKLSIVLPLRNGQAPRGLLGVVNHDGTVIYNQRGEGRLIKQPRKPLKAADYRGFLPEVDLVANEGYMRVIEPGTPQFKVLEQRYLELAIKDLQEPLAYAYKTHGTNRTPEEWRRIALQDEKIYNLADALFSKLNGFFFIPFNPQGTAISFGIMKLVDIASIWDNKMRLPHYGNHLATMNDVASANERGEFYSVCISLKLMKQQLEQQTR